ncbi:hypothetical protein BC826DRAFT_1106321 [Russula brevipes]|nr:hypothetical protein BC826DRAFT_1106321 [Russula brevipes]
MSSIDVDVGPHAAEHAWINSIISVSAAVLLYYDYLLTLPREILYMWPPHNKQGWFTAACLLNRYVPVLGHIPVVVSYFIPLNPRGLHTYHECFVMVVQTHAGTLCMIRVYALWGRSRYILGLLLVAGTMSIVTASAALLASSRVGGETLPVISSFAGCSQFTPTVGGRLAAIAWTGVLVFDSLIFSLTLYKAFTIGKGIRLLDVIVRDGTMYFSYDPLRLFPIKTSTIPSRALFIMNLANILTLRFVAMRFLSCRTPYLHVIVLSNTAHAKNGDHDIYERVRLDPRVDITTLA